MRKDTVVTIVLKNTSINSISEQSDQETIVSIVSGAQRPSIRNEVTEYREQSDPRINSIRSAATKYQERSDRASKVSGAQRPSIRNEVTEYREQSDRSIKSIRSAATKYQEQSD